MYYDRLHTPSATLEDGFYIIEDHGAPNGIWVLRVKTQPEDARRHAGQQVIAIARDPAARTFYEYAEIRTTIGLSSGSSPSLQMPAVWLQYTEDVQRQLVGRLALDGRIYRFRVFTSAEREASIQAAIARLIDGANAAEDAGRMYARKFGRCRACNRKLTHRDSVETGIGPECAGTRKHREVVAETPQKLT